jgi:hypothetical protein
MTEARRRSARERGDTVDGYAAKQPPETAATIEALRRAVRRAAPDGVESIKWGQPVYEQNGPFAYIRAAKEHVTFGFWRGTQVADPEGLLTGGGDVMRHMKIANGEPIRDTAIEAMVRDAVRLNAENGDPTRSRMRSRA